MPYGESYDKTEYNAEEIPDALPDGWYPVRIGDVSKEIVKKEEGDPGPDVPMANVKFVVRGGDYEGQIIFRRFPLPVTAAAEGKKIQYNRFLVPFLEALGAPKQGLKPDSWIGTELWIETHADIFKGAKQMSVVNYSAENPTKKK